MTTGSFTVAAETPIVHQDRLGVARHQTAVHAARHRVSAADAGDATVTVVTAPAAAAAAAAAVCQRRQTYVVAVKSFVGSLRSNTVTQPKFPPSQL